MEFDGFDQDKDKLEPQVGLEYICKLPEGAKVLDMTEIDGKLVVATDKGVYILEGKELVELKPDFSDRWDDALKELVEEGK